jgi:hypothetical protein
MSAAETVSIPARFCGPPGWGNGGFACGTFAAPIEGPAEVTLRRPVPLAEPIALERRPDGSYGAIAADGELIAEVRAAPPLEGIEPPLRPSPEQAAAASADSPFRGPRHAYPGCFVCGPEHPDGLAIHVGTLPGDQEAFADSFTIPPSLAAAPGRADPAVAWAALDCPSYVPSLWGEVPVLLGRLTAEHLAPLPVGEPLVAVSWPLGIDGRKLHSASAVLDAEGRMLARARALWIRLREPLVE